MFWNRVRKAGLEGLDIGANSVKSVELKFKGGHATLASVGHEILLREAIVEGQIVDPEAVANAIAKISNGDGNNTGQTAVSVGGWGSIIKFLKLPAMSAEELDECIDWHAEEHIPFDISEVMLGYQIVESSPDGLDVWLAASKQIGVENLMGVLDRAGKQASIVDVDAFALHNCYVFNYAPEGDSLVTLLDIGATKSVISILKGSRLEFTRGISFGGDEYNQRLQKELGLTLDEAEDAKRNSQSEIEIKEGEVESTVQSLSKRLLRQALIDSVSEMIATEIRKTFDFYRAINEYETSEVQKIMLSGGSSKLVNLAEFLSKRLEIPVERLDPFRRIEFDERRFSDDQLSEIAPQMAIAVGLALRGAENSPAIAINLLSDPRQPLIETETERGNGKRKYRFKGRNQFGDLVTGERMAETRKELREMLRYEGINVISERAILARLNSFATRFRRKRVTLRELERFTRRFDLMIKCGAPLVSSLDTLSNIEENPYLSTVLRKVATDLEKGKRLYDAMPAHPDVFDRQYLALIEAGETGGVLDLILTRLQSRLQQRLEWGRKIKLALFYPFTAVALLLLTAALFVVLSTWSNSAALPGRGFGLIALTLTGVVAVIVLAFIAIYKTSRGRQRLDLFVLRAPWLGKFYRTYSVGRYCRILSTLLSSGVPILQSLDISADNARNVVVSEAITKTRMGIEWGQGFVDSMPPDANVFSPMDRMLWGIGEQTGALDAMLATMADFYEHELDAALASLPLVLLPGITVLYALIVGLVFLVR